MTPCDEAQLASKAFHFHIKDHMAIDILVPVRDLVVTFERFECNFDILHFLGNAIHPKGITILLVNPQRVSHQRGEFDDKLVSFPEASRLLILH